MLDLYSNIKYYRKQLDMSQAELAAKTGYTDRSSIAKIEKGEVDLPQSKISMFASALGVTPKQLMGDTGYEDESPSTLPGLSDRAMQIALSYDQADERTRTAVEVALGIDFEKDRAAERSCG